MEATKEKDGHFFVEATPRGRLNIREKSKRAIVLDGFRPEKEQVYYYLLMEDFWEIHEILVNMKSSELNRVEGIVGRTTIDTLVDEVLELYSDNQGNLCKDEKEDLMKFADAFRRATKRLDEAAKSIR